jgi:3-hydroxyacyl-CoA dehydrogenase
LDPELWVQVACHFANIGVEVLLLDIVPRELTEAETKRIDIREQSSTQSLVNEHLGNALKSKPLYLQSSLLIVYRQEIRQTTWQIATVDWIIEVVVERLDIKKLFFEQVEVPQARHIDYVKYIRYSYSLYE